MIGWEALGQNSVDTLKSLKTEFYSYIFKHRTSVTCGWFKIMFCLVVVLLIVVFGKNTFFSKYIPASKGTSSMILQD